MKVYSYKNGWTVIAEAPSFPSGMRTVLVRNAAGELHDKVRCDSASEASAYFRSFKAIARNA